MNLDSIIIRPYCESDVALLFEAARESIENMYPFLPWCHPNYSLQDAREWVFSRQLAWQESREYSFVITTNSEEIMLGGVGINAINWAHCTGNLGYWVRKSVLGQGIAVKASQLAAQYAFEELKLNRLEIVLQPMNKASQRVAEKLGAQKEGLLRKRLMVNGEAKDAWLYSLVTEG